MLRDRVFMHSVGLYVLTADTPYRDVVLGLVPGKTVEVLDGPRKKAGEQRELLPDRK